MADQRAFGNPDRSPAEIGAQVRDKAQEAGAQVRDKAQEAGAQVRDKAQEAGAQVRDKAQEAGAQVRDKAQEAGAQVRDKAQEMVRQGEETASDSYQQGRQQMETVEHTHEVPLGGRRARGRGLDRPHPTPGRAQARPESNGQKRLRSTAPRSLFLQH